MLGSFCDVVFSAFSSFTVILHYLNCILAVIQLSVLCLSSKRWHGLVCDHDIFLTY